MIPEETPQNIQQNIVRNITNPQNTENKRNKREKHINETNDSETIYPWTLEAQSKNRDNIYKEVSNHNNIKTPKPEHNKAKAEIPNPLPKISEIQSVSTKPLKSSIIENKPRKAIIIFKAEDGLTAECPKISNKYKEYTKSPKNPEPLPIFAPLDKSQQPTFGMIQIPRISTENIQSTPILPMTEKYNKYNNPWEELPKNISTECKHQMGFKFPWYRKFCIGENNIYNRNINIYTRSKTTETTPSIKKMINPYQPITLYMVGFTFLENLLLPNNAYFQDYFELRLRGVCDSIFTNIHTNGYQTNEHQTHILPYEIFKHVDNKFLDQETRSHLIQIINYYKQENIYIGNNTQKVGLEELLDDNPKWKDAILVFIKSLIAQGMNLSYMNYTNALSEDYLEIGDKDWKFIAHALHTQIIYYFPENPDINKNIYTQTLLKKKYEGKLSMNLLGKMRFMFGREVYMALYKKGLAKRVLGFRKYKEISNTITANKESLEIENIYYSWTIYY